MVWPSGDGLREFDEVDRYVCTKENPLSTYITVAFSVILECEKGERQKRRGWEGEGGRGERHEEEFEAEIMDGQYVTTSLPMCRIYRDAVPGSPTLSAAPR